MKNRKLMTILSSFILTFAVVCSGCGGTGGTQESSGSAAAAESAEAGEKDENLQTASETAGDDQNAQTGSAAAEGDENTQVSTENAEENPYQVIFDTSNERIQVQVIGAERIQRGTESFLRVYIQRKNLTEKLMNAQYSFITYQDDVQIYVVGRGYPYLDQYKTEEGIKSDKDMMDTMEFLVTRGYFLMPGVTRQSAVDIKLNSDSDVRIKFSCGELSEEQVWDLNNLPGAPAELKRVEPVADPERWKDAVVSYSDTGTIQLKRVGELGFAVKEVSLVNDPTGKSPTGKLIQLTTDMTNNTDKEQKAERLISGYFLALMMQDGQDLWNVTSYVQKENTVLAPGETGEVKTYFQPLSDSPVFVAFNGEALSAYTSEEDHSDNFGMEYTLE